MSPQTPPPTPPPARRIAPATIVATALALALGWVLGATWLRTPLLATFAGEEALAPLYAFLDPRVSARALAFVVLAASAAALAPRLADPARTSRQSFTLALALSGLLLPGALFLVRGAPGELGSQFLTYQDEEFFHDAERIGSLAVFLDSYVERMPELSLHGQHFPPGNALLLWVVRETVGPSPLAAGLVVLACFAGGLLLVRRAAAFALGEGEARQAALLALATPAALDFACTSMDAVFWLAGAWVLDLALRALAPTASPRAGLGLGAALFVATFFSFSAIPLGSWVLCAAVFALHRSRRTLARMLATTALAYVACALALDFATGFPIWACLAQARESGLALMERSSRGDPARHAAGTAFGNAAAYALGAGLALVAASAASIPSGTLRAPHARATLATLAILVAGGIYHLETERIWLFTLPWLALLALVPGPWSARSLRVLLALGFLQALAFEVVLFTLW